MRAFFAYQSSAELQMLEARRLLSAQISFDPDTGLLNVIGDDSNDQIDVSVQFGDDNMPPAMGIAVIVRESSREVFHGHFAEGGLTEVRVNGGFGNDTLSISNNDAVVNTFVSGDQGSDHIEAFIAQRATPSRIHGGEGNDFITLLAGREALEGYVVLGEGGDDVINGSRFSDILYGDNESVGPMSIPGDDEIHGGGGDDALFGGEGNDQLFGEDGADSLNGGNGSDFIDGGSGEDQAIVDDFDKITDVETILS